MNFMHRINKVKFAFRREQTTINLEDGLEKVVWSPGAQLGNCSCSGSM